MIDFFDTKCQQIPVNRKSFGLKDDEDGKPAYITETQKDLWQAEIINNRGENGEGYEIIFTAVDKCIIQDDQLKDTGRCEGMLITKKHLFLVELKDKRKLNSGEMLDQLTDTINLLKRFHSEKLDSFTHKKVYGCNSKKKGKFVVIDNEFKKSFQYNHGFRVDLQTNIVVI